MARKFLDHLDGNGQAQLVNMLAEILASDPGSPAAGRFWVRSDTGTLNYRNGAGTATIVLGRLDQITAPTASVALNGQKITGMADGTAATDAASVGQLNAAITGFDWKASVRAASTANVSTTYTATAGTSARGQHTAAPNTLDGVTLAANDRILLKNQTTGAQNGIFVVTTVGTGANGVWDRATDFDQDAEVTAGSQVPVTEGTANADSVFMLATNDPIVIGGASGTALSFIRLGPATATGVTKFSATGPGSTGTTWTINHALGTQDVHVQIRDASTNVQVEATVTMTDTNNVTVTFSASQTLNTLRAVVIG